LPMTGTPDNELGESQNSQLATAIGEVASRIERYRGQRIGEQDTKAALIVALLRALGWDVENLDEVRLEYKRRPTDRPVDYCLLLRDPVLFVEAKALDESLGDHRWTNQVISYAAVAGVEWVALTNGDEWRLYNAGAPVPAEEKLFRTVHVSENPDEAARTLALLKREDLRTKSLTQLWRSAHVDARVAAAVEQLFSPEPDPWLVRRLSRSLDGLATAEVRAALARARARLDFPDAGDTVSRVPERRPIEPPPGPPEAFAIEVGDLIAAGSIRPPLELRKTYLGREVRAEVQADGRVRFESRVFNSLSLAAAAARAAVKGDPPPPRKYWQTNGWSFWNFRDVDGTWRPIGVLRQRHLQTSPSS
jgi:hypothetical protein